VLAVLAVLGVNAETCSVGCAWRECRNLQCWRVLGVNAETCSVGCAWRECRNLQCWLCLA